MSNAPKKILYLEDQAFCTVSLFDGLGIEHDENDLKDGRHYHADIEGKPVEIVHATTIETATVLAESETFDAYLLDNFAPSRDDGKKLALKLVDNHAGKIIIQTGTPQPILDELSKAGIKGIHCTTKLNDNIIPALSAILARSATPSPDGVSDPDISGNSSEQGQRHGQ